MRLPKQVVRIANAITNVALLTGIPRPPYTRRNALVIETVGYRSGKRRRIPVGYLDDGGRIIVVVEHGLKLTEVAATIRSQVGYEVERLTGLRVASVDVHIDDVRQSA